MPRSPAGAEIPSSVRAESKISCFVGWRGLFYFPGKRLRNTAVRRVQPSDSPGRRYGVVTQAQARECGLPQTLVPPLQNPVALEKGLDLSEL